MDNVKTQSKSFNDFLKEDMDYSTLSKDYTEMREDLDFRFGELKLKVQRHLPVWQELCDYIQPERGRYINTSWLSKDSGPIEGVDIFNTIAQDALETLSAGMLSGISSYDKKWFNFSASVGVENTYEVKKWLNEVGDKMFFALQRSNFYQGSQIVYNDVGLIGTGPSIVYEDEANIFRIVNLNPGEYLLETDDTGNVVSLFREFSLTTYQMVKKFGIENVSRTIREHYEAKRNLSNTHTIYHCMQPSDEFDKYGKPKGTYTEVYWSSSCDKDSVLQVRTYKEKPFFAPRWYAYGLDAYGIAPAMKILSSVKQLQILQEMLVKVIELYSDPALQAPKELEEEPSAFEPGGVVFVEDDKTVRPIYSTNGDTSQIRLEIERLEKEINSAFYKDLWLLLAQLQGIQPRTSNEILERRAEKLSILSPALQRLQTEYLDPCMERIFKIMFRRGLFSPPPKELMDGDKIKIVYTSFLYSIQNAKGAIPSQSFMTIVEQVARLNPDVIDKIDLDYFIEDLANSLDIDPRMLKDPKIVNEIRQNRANQMMQQQQAQNAMQGVQAMKNLSQVNPGANNPLMDAIGSLV